MRAQLPDGTYQFTAQSTLRLLTDLEGALVAVPQARAPIDCQSWALANAEDGGTVTLRCIGTGRYLALAERSDGIYYDLADGKESWIVAPLGEEYELIRSSTTRRLWLAGLLLDITPVLQQGVERDVVPTRWVVTGI